MTKTRAGNFFEDFAVGQLLRHATPRTATEGDRGLYQALYGSSPKAWWHRMIGVFHGALDVMRLSMRGYKVILRKDGLWNNLRSRLRLSLELTRALRHMTPFVLRAALPGHTPRSERDPQWVLDWLAGHANADENHVPLVDTRDPNMPVPFAA